MRILLSSHSLTGYDPERALQLAQELEFDGIELFPGRLTSDFDIQSLVNLQMQYEKRIWNVHMLSIAPLVGRLHLQPWKTWRLLIRRSVTIATELGAHVLVVHPFPSAVLKKRARRLMASVLGELGKPSLDYSIENPGIGELFGIKFDRVFLSDPDDLYAFSTRHNTGITLDTSHCARRGIDPAMFFQTYGDRINNIHLSNYAHGQCHQPLAEGTIDFERFFAVLRKHHYGGSVALETRPMNDEKVRRDMRFLIACLRENESG